MRYFAIHPTLCIFENIDISVKIVEFRFQPLNLIADNIENYDEY